MSSDANSFSLPRTLEFVKHFFHCRSNFFDPEVLRSKKQTVNAVCFLCWRYLSSRSVSRQVFSAQVSLTSVFGMGTGGPSPQSTPTYFSLKRKVSKRNFNNFLLLTVLLNDKHLIFRGSLWSASQTLHRDWCAFTDSNRGPTD